MENQITIKYTTGKVADLSESDRNLVKSAKEIAGNAYARYSQFKVGAALLLADGEIVLGSNQENIAYPSGLCAERVALFYAGANFPNVVINTICIVAKGDLLEEGMNLSPCGGCRQVMVESEMRQNSGIRVILVNQDDTVSIFNSAASLLPLTFGL